MSFSNILSTSNPVTPTLSPPVPRKTPVVSEVHYRPEALSMDPSLPAKVTSAPSRRHESIGSDWDNRHRENHNVGSSNGNPTRSAQESEKYSTALQSQPSRMVNGGTAPKPTTVPAIKHNLIVSEKDFQAALARIDAMELSDAEGEAFEDQRREFSLRTTKRFRDLEEMEVVKCKVYQSHSWKSEHRLTNPPAPSHRSA